MKKYLKKRLSIFMTIVMMVSLLGNMNWTVHAEEPAPQPGTYAVYYDGNGGADIQVNGVSIQGWNDFMGGDNIPDKLSFKLTPPDFSDGETPIVDIIELDGNYGSEPLYTTRVQDGDPNKISIGTEGNDFTFEFTPRNNNPLEVNVWWTEYSFFEGTDDKPIILEIDHHGEGRVNVQGVASTDAVEWRSFKKVRVASGTTGVTLTWENAENKPEKIRVEGGDPNSQDGWLELTESHYSGNSCIVPLNQTIQDMSGDEVEADFYYIQVIYPDNGPQPGTFQIHYDDRDNAGVVWGEDVMLPGEGSLSFIDPNSTEENTIFSDIKLTFHVPDGLEKTSLEVKIHDVTFYDNGETKAIEDDHLKTLFGEDAAALFGTDQDGNVTFSYTPTCDEFIDMQVNWLRPQGPQPGTFQIHYDDRDNAGVVWGEDVTLPGEGSLSFIDPNSTEENTIFSDIKLTFHVPDGLEKTSLEVKIHDVTFYDNGETKAIEDDHLKTLFGEDAAALFGTDQDGNVTFSYTPTCDEFIDMQVNWLRPQGPQPGTFQIHYDDRDNAGVVWGEDVTLPGEGSLSFIDPNSTEENTIFSDIKLTFHVPDGLEKTSLEVKIHDVTFYDNGETKAIEDDHLKTLFGEDAAALFGTDQDGNVTFSYTPTCDESIDMQVNWIRPQGTQPGTFSIRYDDRDNAGVVWGENVTLPGNGSLSFIDPSSTEGNTIYTDIKLTFHVPDGLEKTSLEVKFNGTTLYDNGESRRIEDERLETLLGTNDASDLFGTDAQGNVFFAYTPNSMDNIMIEVNWLGNVGPQPGTLNIHYDDRDNAKVVWGENVTLDREASVSFMDPSSTEENPVYNQIKLTFYVPDGLEKTSLDVRVHGQSFYDNGNALAIEDEHLKTLFGEDAATLFGTDTEGNVTFTYTPTCDEFIDIEVYWIGAGDVEEDGSPAEQIASHGYAYFVRHVAVDEQPAVFKHYFATEIWYEYFIPNYNGYRGPFAGQFGITSLEELKNKLTVEEKSTEPDAATGLYYCSYSLDLGEEEEPVTGKAYVLDSKNKFIVQTGDVLHCVEVQYNPNENGDLFPQDVMVKGSGEVKVFGNGTCMVGGLDTGSASSQGWHVTQEHSGIIHETNTPWHDSEGRMGGISCRLIVCEDDFSGAIIKCERDAAAWNFVNVSIYDISENQGEAVAEVYYGSDTVSFETVNFDNVPTGNLITGVSLDTTKISAQAATITASQTRDQFDLHFNTGYDSIPVIVEFEDGTTRYVTINRVGLKMNVSSEDRNKFTVWHGTDHSVLYDVQESGDTKAIYATFYYAGDARPANPVSLFTTITTAEGVERKLIDTPVTMDGTKVEWENTLGEANQGTDKFYDDFLIWSGTEEEYNALQKVEAIVFDAGNDDAFGGVKVGSGTGVVWTKER